MKTLVAYFSQTGSTEKAAKLISESASADLEAITEVKKRKISGLSYLASGMAAARRQKSDISKAKYDPNDYDLVIIGTPIWAGNMAPAVRAYLSENKIKGKKVALFCSCGGSTGKAFDEMKALLEDCKVVGELPLKDSEIKRGEIDSRVKKWLSEISKT